MRCVDSGRVAIFDATNSTRKRRQWLKTQLENLPVKLLFIESVCTDEQIVDKNIWNAKVTLPEYAVRFLGLRAALSEGPRPPDMLTRTRCASACPSRERNSSQQRMP